MTLSRSAIEELQQIYKRLFKQDLSDDEARTAGHRLLRLFYALTRSPRSELGKKKF